MKSSPSLAWLWCGMKPSPSMVCGFAVGCLIDTPQHTAAPPAPAEPTRHRAADASTSVDTATIRFQSRFPAGVRTPDAVSGRVHGSVQTDRLVVVLSDRDPVADTTTQTGAEMNRPSSPLFVRVKTGVDVATQVEGDDPALFDFDAEVAPVVDALVVNVLEAAVMEAHEDAELDRIRRQQVGRG